MTARMSPPATALALEWSPLQIALVDAEVWTILPLADLLKDEAMVVVRGREGEAVAMGGVLSARGVGRDALVGARPPLGGHVLRSASADDGLKPYVSAQRGSNKH